MAITLGTNPISKTLVVVMKDWRGQKKTERILLKGTVTDADVIAILTGLDSLSNAEIISAELTSSVVADGYKANPISGVPNENIQEFMALNLFGTNPINTAKRVFKTVAIPAPIKAIEATSGSGIAVADNVALNAMVAALETNLAYVAANGTTYSGLFTYMGGQRLAGAEIVDNV
jgi:hypothetical protein